MEWRVYANRRAAFCRVESCKLCHKATSTQEIDERRQPNLLFDPLALLQPDLQQHNLPSWRDGQRCGPQWRDQISESGLGVTPQHRRAHHIKRVSSSLNEMARTNCRHSYWFHHTRNRNSLHSRTAKDGVQHRALLLRATRIRGLQQRRGAQSGLPVSPSTHPTRLAALRKYSGLSPAQDTPATERRRAWSRSFGPSGFE